MSDRCNVCRGSLVAVDDDDVIVPVLRCGGCGREVPAIAIDHVTQHAFVARPGGHYPSSCVRCGRRPEHSIHAAAVAA